MRSPCSHPSLYSLALAANEHIIPPPFFLPRALACQELRLEAPDGQLPSIMTSYYIDPDRCFEVPFRIPLPDKGTMAARLASIHLIMRDARERQSQFCAEHRRKLSSQPCRYRHKAKAMMDMGQLKSFVGNLARRYIDYLDFHQESPKKLSPLAIQIPLLCPSLSPPRSYLLCVHHSQCYSPP